MNDSRTHATPAISSLFCERFDISPRTLQDYRDRKVIPYTQFAGKILYKASDLERILEENYRGGGKR